jgi:hypothetical protein
MPLVLLPEMRRHFHETGSLEVEALFPQKILDEIRASVKVLFPISKISFTDRYLKGRDLFRTQEPFRRLEMRKETVQFILELSQVNYLHLACDQLFDWTSSHGDSSSILPKNASFSELMSITPLVLGMLIALEGQGDDKPSVFPKEPGNVTFFSPEIPIDWEKDSLKGRSFLFVAYAPRGAIVRFNPQDPNTNLLKRMDYQDGSPIHNRTHPLFRL